MKIRPHQQQKAKELLKVLNKYSCAYLAGEVRSGKTITVLETARLFKAKDVLFITKKKAIDSIQSDFGLIGFDYQITIVNYESLHKLERFNFDLIIYDESHGMGSFPKPAKRTKLIRLRFYNTPCIWLSGTPAAESYSQYYHQFFVNRMSPFVQHTNFYRWAKIFVNIKKKRIGTHEINDYSDAKIKEIEKVISPYIVTMTQDDAGFEVNIKETILRVPTPHKIDSLAKRLIKDRAIEGKRGYIMAEMPAKLQGKIHQIYSGTVIIEKDTGATETIILSNFKAKFIKDTFAGRKVAIAYYYQAELNVIKEVFGEMITTDLDEFNSTDKNFAIQQSSSEGMNISRADCLVYMNLGFSGKNYIQSRDRLTVKDREHNNVYFIIESPGITDKILDAVRGKADYNLRSFQKDFL